MSCNRDYLRLRKPQKKRTSLRQKSFVGQFQHVLAILVDTVAVFQGQNCQFSTSIIIYHTLLNQSQGNIPPKKSVGDLCLKANELIFDNFGLPKLIIDVSNTFLSSLMSAGIRSSCYSIYVSAQRLPKRWTGRFIETDAQQILGISIEFFLSLLSARFRSSCNYSIYI